MFKDDPMGDIKYLLYILKNPVKADWRLREYNRIKPLYLESWVVTIVDKSVATYEYFNFKFKDKFTLWIVFMFNFLSIKL